MSVNLSGNECMGCGSYNCDYVCLECYNEDKAQAEKRGYQDAMQRAERVIGKRIDRLEANNIDEFSEYLLANLKALLAELKGGS
jgi:hypothetical protein